MKKIAAKVLLAICVTVSFAGITAAADNAIHNPKVSQACTDDNGKWIDSKDCDPNGCGCLFHSFGRFVKELFD